MEQTFFSCSNCNTLQLVIKSAHIALDNQNEQLIWALFFAWISWNQFKQINWRTNSFHWWKLKKKKKLSCMFVIVCKQCSRQRNFLTLVWPYWLIFSLLCIKNALKTNQQKKATIKLILPKSCLRWGDMGLYTEISWEGEQHSLESEGESFWEMDGRKRGGKKGGRIKDVNAGIQS